MGGTPTVPTSAFFFSLTALGFNAMDGVMELAAHAGQQHSLLWPRGSQEAPTKLGGDLGCFERYYTGGIVALPPATSNTCQQTIAVRLSRSHSGRSQPRPSASPSPPPHTMVPAAAMADASGLFGLLWCVYSVAQHSPKEMLSDFRLSVQARS